MSNPLNHGHLTGRVSQDIKEFTNADGSKNLLVSLAVDDNFKSGSDNKVQTNFVPLRVFLSKSVQGRGTWDRVHKGDLITVDYRVNAKPYVKGGETIYPMTLEVEGFPAFLESKATVDARAARNAAAPAASAAAPAEAATGDVETLRAQLAAAEAAEAAAASGYNTDSPFAG